MVGLVALGGCGIVLTVLVRALSQADPAQVQAERLIARAGAALGGAVHRGGWRTDDGILVQAGWRPRHGKPAEPITWVGRRAAPRLETQPMVLLGTDGGVSSADVPLPLSGQDAIVGAVHAAGSPLPLRLAVDAGRVTGMVVAGWPTSEGDVARAVTLFRGF